MVVVETIFSAADIQRYPTNAPVTFDCVSVCMSFLWWWWRRFSLQPISRGTRPMLLSLLIVSLCACLFCGGGGDDFLCSRYPEVPDQCSCHFCLCLCVHVFFVVVVETIFSAADIQRYPTNAPVTFDCVSVCMSFLWWWWRRFSLQPISRGTRPMLLSLLIVSLCACLFLWWWWCPMFYRIWYCMSYFMVSCCTILWIVLYCMVYFRSVLCCIVLHSTVSCGVL